MRDPVAILRFDHGQQVERLRVDRETRGAGGADGVGRPPRVSVPESKEPVRRGHDLIVPKQSGAFAVGVPVRANDTRRNPAPVCPQVGEGVRAGSPAGDNLCNGRNAVDGVQSGEDDGAVMIARQTT